MAFSLFFMSYIFLECNSRAKPWKEYRMNPISSAAQHPLCLPRSNYGSHYQRVPRERLSDMSIVVIMSGRVNPAIFMGVCFTGSLDLDHTSPPFNFADSAQFPPSYQAPDCKYSTLTQPRMQNIHGSPQNVKRLKVDYIRLSGRKEAIKFFRSNYLNADDIYHAMR